MTLSVQTDRTLIRAAASSTRYVLARITAPRAPAREMRIPVNIGIVLDRSGSMGGERKFGLAREAVEQSLRMLRSEDRFALIVYDTEVDVLMPSSRATPEVKRRALDALREIAPRGGTDLGAGWLRGCEQLAEFPYDDQVSRCLLLTDGLANHGTDRDELARHAGELRQRGVSTSTFGVGADFDERLLRDMAHEGGGNFYCIEGASQIPEMLTGELGEALEVTLRNASLVVTLPPGATAETLNRYRQKRGAEPNELRIEVGELVSGQELEVVVKLVFPRGEVGERQSARFEVASGGNLDPSAECRQEWTYATHHDNDVQPRNREVDRAVAAVYAARAREEATEANRDQRYDDARCVLEATARRILGYAGSEVQLRAIADELAHAVHEYGMPMSLSSVKASHFAAHAALMGRDDLGRARR